MIVLTLAFTVVTILDKSRKVLKYVQRFEMSYLTTLLHSYDGEKDFF